MAKTLVLFNRTERSGKPPVSYIVRNGVEGDPTKDSN